MLKFKTSCAVLAYILSNLLNEVGLSLFRYFEVGLRVCDIVVKKFTFAISSPDEFLHVYLHRFMHNSICIVLYCSFSHGYFVLYMAIWPLAANLINNRLDLTFPFSHSLLILDS